MALAIYPLQLMNWHGSANLTQKTSGGVSLMPKKKVGLDLYIFFLTYKYTGF